MKKVDVIVPVYRGLDETKECIDSALRSLPEWANLIIINDYSPDPELTIWLRNYSNRFNFQLLENHKNMGFVATVNRGMALNLDHDVLLLNSDVEVPNSNWLERMRNAANCYEKIGSITPFSNNATICSFPNFCEDNELFSNLSVNELDNIFSTLDHEEELIEVPTGVGFCMYITRDALNDVGYFDEETFGKGYGEENDWCQRALKKGWKNFHQLNVFAYHKGGVSFAEEGDPRKQRALELLAQLHPTYTQQVQEFIAKDPAANVRQAAIFNYLNKTNKKTILLVSHRLGGGVKQHVSELIKLLGKDVNFILTYPSDQKNSMEIEYFSGDQLIKQHQVINIESNYEIFIELLNSIKLDRVHFHHTMGIPKIFFQMIEKLALPYDFTVHDYYLFNGNPTLTDIKGNFIEDDNQDRDLVCLQRYPIEEPLNSFKEQSKKFLNLASRVIFPSIDSYSRFIKYFSFIRDKSIVCYHPDINKSDIRNSIKNYEYSKKKKLKVLVLGALSQEKGADELEYVANHCDNIEFHLLGYAYRPLSSVITYGPYQQDDIRDKVTSIEPDVIWFTAKWPETYSYTLSTALLMQYPVICPDIGAFSERVFELDGILLLDKNLTHDQLVKFWMCYSEKQSLQDFIIFKQESDFTKERLDEAFYTKSYLNFLTRDTGGSSIYQFIKLAKKIGSFHEKPSLNNKEKLLSILWEIRNSKFFNSVSKFIPYKFQRFIKRKLSSKPIHDLINKD